MSIRSYKENYSHGSIDISFDDLPSIKLVSIKPNVTLSLVQRLKTAMKKRTFELTENWAIHFKGLEYKGGINGRIIIPKKVDGTIVVFDGASVPLARTISWLTQGILDPLGVMFTASVVHDFAYKYGFLYVEDTTDPSTLIKIPIARHDTDRVFRDIISTVNRISLVGWIAWYAVRLGWVFVPYNGTRFGGKYPWAEQLVFILISIKCFTYLFSDGVFQIKNALPLLASLALLPLMIWFIINTLSLLTDKNKSG